MATEPVASIVYRIGIQKRHLRGALIPYRAKHVETGNLLPLTITPLMILLK